MARGTSSNGTETTTSDVTQQLEVIRADLAVLTKTMSDLGKDKTSEMADSAKATLDAAKLRAERQVNSVMEQAGHAQGQVYDFMRQQPGTVIGLAAGVGFLVGIISARK